MIVCHVVVSVQAEQTGPLAAVARFAVVCTGHPAAVRRVMEVAREVLVEHYAKGNNPYAFAVAVEPMGDLRSKSEDETGLDDVLEITLAPPAAERPHPRHHGYKHDFSGDSPC